MLNEIKLTAGPSIRLAAWPMRLSQNPLTDLPLAGRSGRSAYASRPERGCVFAFEQLMKLYHGRLVHVLRQVGEERRIGRRLGTGCVFACLSSPSQLPSIGQIFDMAISTLPTTCAATHCGTRNAARGPDQCTGQRQSVGHDDDRSDGYGLHWDHASATTG